jgi:hypothetical protein
VQVYDLGEEQGKPYLALEFVEGGSLATKLRGEPQPPREAALLIEVLARAMHVAHQNGIVHRDLKPATEAQWGKDRLDVLLERTKATGIGKLRKCVSPGWTRSSHC